MRAWLTCLVLAGCAEPVIELQLAMPASTPEGFDLACIGAVDVMGFSAASLADPAPFDIGIRVEALHTPVSCTNISNATTVAELANQLRGHVDVPLPPDGLAALEIRARIGTCAAPPFGEGMLFGGGIYASGADSIAVAMEANISCNAKTQVSVMPLDILALVSDPMHACTIMKDTNVDTTLAGVIRPAMLTRDATGPDVMLFEGSPDFRALRDDGTVSLDTFTSAATDACIAVARDGNLEGSTCVNRGLPTLCGAPGTVELPVVAANRVKSTFDDALVQQYGLPVLGSVWERTATGRAPLQSAGVVAADPTRASVVYLDYLNGELQPHPGATATTASGLFYVYSNGISAIRVAKQGYGPQRLVVGAGNGLDGTAVAVLAAQ